MKFAQIRPAKLKKLKYWPNAFSVLMVTSGLFLAAFAQESTEKVMEKRALEMHRVLGLSSKDAWKKFVKENYSQAFIDKQCEHKWRKEKPTPRKGKPLITWRARQWSSNDCMKNFGSSKIVSIKSEGEILKMILENEQGLSGTFQLKFDKARPYLVGGWVSRLEIKDSEIQL